MHTGNFWKERNTGIHSLIDQRICLELRLQVWLGFVGVLGFYFMFFFFQKQFVLHYVCNLLYN